MIHIRRFFKKIIFTLLVLSSTQTFAISPGDITAFVSDAAVTTTIRSKILMDQSLSNLKIDVGTVNGVVTLIGTVGSDSEASTLVRLATETEGVKDVNTSQLAVANNNQGLSDTLLTAKVNGLFVRDKLFASKVMTIHVETHNATVYLTGTADNQKQADFAVEIARSVRGVDKVDSRIQVK